MQNAKNTVEQFANLMPVSLVFFAWLWAVIAIGNGLIGLAGRNEQTMLDSGWRSPEDSAAGPLRFADIQAVPTGHFNYSGSPAWASIRLIVDPIIQAERREFQLRYVQPLDQPVGSRTGIQMLLNQDISLVQSTRPPSRAEYRAAEEQGYSLTQVPVAIDGITVAVNPQLAITGLTLTQLAQIYSGDITNWQDLGGPDLVITPYSPPLQAGDTAEFFGTEILDSEPFGRNVVFVDTTTQALRRLADTPGSIYYASAPELVTQCTARALPLGTAADTLVAPYMLPFVAEQDCPQQRNRINIGAFQTRAYPLTRHLYVVIKNDDGRDEAAGDAYARFLLSRQGQHLILKSGFVPIY